MKSPRCITTDIGVTKKDKIDKHMRNKQRENIESDTYITKKLKKPRNENILQETKIHYPSKNVITAKIGKKSTSTVCKQSTKRNIKKVTS